MHRALGPHLRAAPRESPQRPGGALKDRPVPVARPGTPSAPRPRPAVGPARPTPAPARGVLPHVPPPASPPDQRVLRTRGTGVRSSGAKKNRPQRWSLAATRGRRRIQARQRQEVELEVVRQPSVCPPLRELDRRVEVPFEAGERPVEPDDADRAPQVLVSDAPAAGRRTRGTNSRARAAGAPHEGASPSRCRAGCRRRSAGGHRGRSPCAPRGRAARPG